MKTNIALIGFMGAGKSAAGKILAEKLNKTLVDTDSIIESQSRKSIAQIFSEDGESTFRKIESEVIKKVAAGKNQVIACGGGAVLNTDNVNNLKRDSIIIWLTASPEVIERRTTLDGEGRPLLKGKKTVDEIKCLLQSREPYYESAADIKIDTSELNLNSLIEQIICRLKENADFNK